MGDLRYPPSGTASRKRARNSDLPQGSSIPTPPSNSGIDIEPRVIAGTNRVSALVTSPPEDQSLSDVDLDYFEHLLNLPLYTNELGSLPVHRSFDFVNEAPDLFDNSSWTGGHTHSDTVNSSYTANEEGLHEHPSASFAMPLSDSTTGHYPMESQGMADMWSNIPAGYSE